MAAASGAAARLPGSPNAPRQPSGSTEVGADPYRSIWLRQQIGIGHIPRSIDECDYILSDMKGMIGTINDYVTRATVSISFIEKFKQIIHWDILSQYQKLPEKFIQENFKDLIKTDIEMEQILSEDFIMRNIDRLKMRDICKYQKLSEKTIFAILLYTRDSSLCSVIRKYQRPRQAPGFASRFAQFINTMKISPNVTRIWNK